ncbi:hypothetical protein D3OALGA1CA_5585 [Olavius algarvensis associated proteobacterium Delta 3]|nr:hypothetical protein D3OALGA1CA_5585 [Olavius algarvensis associated proteobacterium Delta 3]
MSVSRIPFFGSPDPDTFGIEIEAKWPTSTSIPIAFPAKYDEPFCSVLAAAKPAGAIFRLSAGHRILLILKARVGTDNLMAFTAVEIIGIAIHAAALAPPSDIRFVAVQGMLTPFFMTSVPLSILCQNHSMSFKLTRLTITISPRCLFGRYGKIRTADSAALFEHLNYPFQELQCTFTRHHLSRMTVLPAGTGWREQGAIRH